MEILLHCDDMGHTKSITRRIFILWKSGCINSFSVLPNGHALEEVAEGLSQEKDREVRIAVHLNLFEGRSICPPESIPMITKRDGELSCRFVDLVRTWVCASLTERNSLLEQVEREWRSQIVRVIEVCRPRKISALDGHVHMHMLPFLFPIAVRLAKEYRIPEIRIPEERLHFSRNIRDSVSLDFAVNIIKHAVLRLCSILARRILSEAGLCFPGSFVGILYSGNMTSESALAGIAKAWRSGSKSVEVVFHAGRASIEEACQWNKNKRAGIFSLSQKRDAEFQELNELNRKIHQCCPFI